MLVATLYRHVLSHRTKAIYQPFWRMNPVVTDVIAVGTADDAYDANDGQVRKTLKDGCFE